MNYYDKQFRQNLMDLLNNYRKILVQLETAGDKTQIIFLSESINKVDRACQIIKPSLLISWTKRKSKIAGKRVC